MPQIMGNRWFGFADIKIFSADPADEFDADQYGNMIENGFYFDTFYFVRMNRLVLT